ncbi:MAG: hypothetical protein V1790_09640 [Planctomycetota bacterium]
MAKSASSTVVTSKPSRRKAPRVRGVFSPRPGVTVPDYVRPLVDEFIAKFEPLERQMHLNVDARTSAQYVECHVGAGHLTRLGTVDVPLDPDEQSDYRANRELVQDHAAFQRMKDDALQRRTFSNIVAEFTTEFDAEHPLKIIGGQHRFEAIKQAFDAGVDVPHGLKVYFALSLEQRVDVQLISNTVIAVSPDLYDRIQETARGPELRDWSQRVGLLQQVEDFADKRQRGVPLTVRAVRTFITNYYKGVDASRTDFNETDTTPIICATGAVDPEWEATRNRPDIWRDKDLDEAGREFAFLVDAQRNHFSQERRGGRGRPKVDFPEKASNFAILSAWPYVAGLLRANKTRLQRHYGLRKQPGHDPLNAEALAHGKHKTDADTYRGLGYRQDQKERGRFVELFFLQAEKGNGIDKKLVHVAIMRYHAKRAVLDVREAEASGEAPQTK